MHDRVIADFIPFDGHHVRVSVLVAPQRELPIFKIILAIGCEVAIQIHQIPRFQSNKDSVPLWTGPLLTEKT